MLKELREQLGLSQREFGKRIGRTGAYISQVESGKIQASPATIAAIEEVFGKGAEDGSLGERLRLARTKRGYTQGELAKVTDCNRNTISAAEAGKSTPSATLISRICSYLWISEDWMRFGMGSMERSELVVEVLEAIRTNPEVRKAAEMYLKSTKSQDC